MTFNAKTKIRWKQSQNSSPREGTEVRAHTSGSGVPVPRELRTWLRNIGKDE